MEPFDPIVLRNARASLVGMMLGDIRKAFSGKAKMGAAILSMCALDTLGVLAAEKKDIITGSRTTFVDFVKSKHVDEKYKVPMRGYLWDQMNKEEVKNLPLALYIGMRCLLVHNYASSGFWFTDSRPESHLILVRPVASKDARAVRVCINVDTLMADARKATLSYCDDLEHDSMTYEYFMIQTDGGKLLQVLPDDEYEILEEGKASWERFDIWNEGLRGKVPNYRAGR